MNGYSSELMKKIRVNLKNRPYDILVGRGLLKQAGKLLKSVASGRKVFVVSNRKIAKAAGIFKILNASLKKSGFEVIYHELPNGNEKDKSETELLKLWKSMARARLDRSSTVIGLGGGVAGDIAGFAASTYMRGINVVQIPTTLLAQVDSAIGGKTGIDLTNAKNMVGTFHQPKLVISDLDLVAHLPLGVLQGSFAEIIKYGVIRDPKLFELLEAYGEAFLTHAAQKRLSGRDFAFLQNVVARSAKIKAEVVAKDEYETKGLRMILNYGHTFGHALEGASNYKLTHGQAVGYGMHLAACLAHRLGLAGPRFVIRQGCLIESLGLSTDILEVGRKNRLHSKALIDLMLRDKKTRSGRVRFILPRRIGKVEVVTFQKPDLALVRDIFRKLGIR